MWRLCRSAPSAGEKRFWTCTTFPTFQHSGFYFPPAASKDRAVNGIEIKDFMILWTYSQWRRDLVFIPPFSPEREMCCILPLISFCILSDINLQLTVFSSLLSFMYPLHVLLIYYAFPYPNKEESIRMTDIWDSSSSLARSILKSIFNNIPPAKRFVFHGLVRLSVKKTPEAYDFCIRFRSFLR